MAERLRLQVLKLLKSGAVNVGEFSIRLLHPERTAVAALLVLGDDLLPSYGTVSL
jgi:hypothetical protein